MRFAITGLPAGTYAIEAYSYIDSVTASANDGSTYPPYKLDSNHLQAGISGALAATSAEYSSTGFDADAHPDQVLRWSDVVVAEGETVELVSSSPSEYPVLNAFIIKGLALNLPRPTIDTQPASTSIAEGATASLSVAATASAGSLSYQWYQGASGDTSNPVGTDSASFTSPALAETTGYWVRVTDDNAATDSETAVVLVQQSGTAERILFIGNSFTNGWTAPVQPYNTANITDLNGSGYGGVPGILKKLADDGGYAVDVGIESVSGSTLSGRYPGKVDLVTIPTWDRYVLQGASTEAIADWRGDAAAASQFNTTVGNWNTAILNANPSAEVWLYAPWASRKQIGDPVDGVTTYYTTAEGPTTYLAEIYAAYNGAATALNLDGWVPVGEAFEDAFENGLPDLWIADDHHANAVGSYLGAVMFYRHLLGGDPRFLPTGPGSAADDLGLTAYEVETVHQLVYDFVLTPPALEPAITSQPADTTIIEGASATLEVVATASSGGGTLSYQWYAGSSTDTSAPISGATNASYTTPTSNSAGTYSYWVAVTDDNGTANSDTATVTVTPDGHRHRHTLAH